MRRSIARFAVLTFIYSLLISARGESIQAARLQNSEAKPVPQVSKRSKPSTTNDEATSLAIATLLQSYGEQIYYERGSVAQGQLSELLYATPAYYPCGYVYTAVLYPLSGDPDLYLHQRVGGTWYKIKQSINGGAATDIFTFTCADITSTATNVDLDVKGYTGATYDFYLYREVSSSSFGLKFPLDGYTKTTALVTAIVDLDTRWNYIQTRTGEVGDYWSGCLAYVNGQNVACTSSNAAAPWAYKKPGGGSYNVTGFSYDDGGTPGTNVYMWYDNHRGYDYAVPEGTSVLAAEDGEVTGIDPALGQVELTHSNGYKTYYLHMRNIQVAVGNDVTQGQKIGEVSHVGAGNANHLHFGVKDASGILLDPYGRPGLYPPMWQ